MSLVVSGLMRAVSTLGVILFAVNSMNWGDTVAHTMAIVTFGFACIFFALESNDQVHSVFSRETLESDRLIQMCGWSVLVLFLITAPDFMHKIFATADLTAVQWIICIVFGSLVLWTAEIEKFIRRQAAKSTITESGTEPAIGVAN